MSLLAQERNLEAEWAEAGIRIEVERQGDWQSRFYKLIPIIVLIAVWMVLVMRLREDTR